MSIILNLQARLPLLVLEKFVVECFSNVPVNHLPADDFSQFRGKESFDNPDFRKMYRLKPIKDLCNVSILYYETKKH